MMNYMPQWYQQDFFLKGRPVSSIEEVRASPIDFDGSMFYFPDTANNRIYTKQINLNGQSVIKAYELMQDFTPQQPSYVTRDEFNQALNKLVAQFEQIKPSQGGKENDKSNATNEYSF